MVEAPRQFAFIGAREMPVQHGGDGKAEHPVAEKFEPLIAAAGLGRRQGAGMGQGLLKQADVAEAMADPVLDAGERIADGQA